MAASRRAAATAAALRRAPAAAARGGAGLAAVAAAGSSRGMASHPALTAAYNTVWKVGQEQCKLAPFVPALVVFAGRKKRWVGVANG